MNPRRRFRKAQNKVKREYLTLRTKKYVAWSRMTVMGRVTTPKVLKTILVWSSSEIMATQCEVRESHWWSGRLGQELLWNWTLSEMEWVLLSGDQREERAQAPEAWHGDRSWCCLPCAADSVFQKYSIECVHIWMTDPIFNIYRRIREKSKQRMDVGWSGIKRRESPLGGWPPGLVWGRPACWGNTRPWCVDRITAVWWIELSPGFGPEKQDSGPGFATGFCEVLE